MLFAAVHESAIGTQEKVLVWPASMPGIWGHSGHKSGGITRGSRQLPLTLSRHHSLEISRHSSLDYKRLGLRWNARLSRVDERRGRVAAKTDEDIDDAGIGQTKLVIDRIELSIKCHWLFAVRAVRGWQGR
jgi:hypothetical protein